MNASAERWRRWLNAALNFFYPEVCQGCGRRRATPREGYICPDCRSQIRLIHPPYCGRCGLPYDGHLTTPFTCANCREMELHFSSARSAVAARGLMLDILHRYKYRQALWFEPLLVDLLVQEAVPELRQGRWDCVVPVPLHPLKQRERGFNQASRLADGLGQAAQLPVRHSLLHRVRPTQTQTRLTRRERAANVRRAFAFRPGPRLRGERIVLVDDVFTTGATTSACARALQAAGAGEVCVWTVARGL